MSASFYNQSGDMFGFDCHRYWVAGLPPPAFTLYIVTIPFTHTVDDDAKITARVTSAGRRMFHGGTSFTFVPHVPIPVGPPCPARAWVEFAWIVLFSKSKAVLAAGSVTGQGKALAICIEGAWGVNLNCNEPTSLPTDKVRSFNSVITTPSGADLVIAALDVAMDFLLGKVVDRLLKGVLGKVVPKKWQDWFKERVPEPVKKILDKKAKEYLGKPFKKGYDQIKKAVLARVNAEVR